MPGRSQMLDELEHLASVEHALCVEYLFLDCALVESGAFNLATFSMTQLRVVNDALRLAGSPASLERATHVRRESASPLAFAPLSAMQLDGFLDREGSIAAAVDARYELLRRMLDSESKSDSEFVDQVAAAVASGLGHAAAFQSFRDDLEQRTPSEYLRPVHDTPVDEVERGLLGISDRYYAFILRALSAGFAHQDELWLDMRELAVNAMFELRAVHGDLIARNLLPRFTLAR